MPTSAVDVYLNLQLPGNSVLNTPGNWIYIGAGTRGIIVYNTGSGFKAYERTCTFDPSQSTAVVEVLNDNVTAVDSTCGSKFSIIDGSVINPPASNALQTYRTEFDGVTLHIFN